LNVPVIRWPGGCYVDDYDWLDGVGTNRQTTIDLVWGVWDPHTFGTDEFIELCRRLNAEPYICQNGLAGIQEMKDWVEYCNAPSGGYADMRISNGHAEPYNVKYWSVGNEMAGTSYYNTVRDAARGMKEVDPSIEVTCSGSHNGSHVDSELLTIAGDDLDLISIHQYAIANFQTHHTPDYLSAIGLSEQPKSYIQMILNDLTDLGYRDQIKITFDEWNLRSWHHPGFPNYSHSPLDPDDPAISAQVAQRDLSLDPSLYTMADALYAASLFNACLRNADDVVMANIAPLVNQTGPLYVHPGGIVKRTHFHTFAMYAQHLKSKVVDSQISSPILAGTSVSLVDAIVTTDDNLSYVLALVNRDPSLPVKCRVDIPGFALDGVFNATILQGDSPDSFNNIDNPDRVAPEEVQLQFVNGVASLPPHSLTIVHLGN
jgi:alpha-N-arabinofuranosidase